MADLDNLPDELNNDNDSIDEPLTGDYGEGDVDDNVEASARASVPLALAAAAERRRQLEAEGAGDEERDYQAAGTYGTDDDMDGGDGDGDDDGRNYNPDYEQLKALWTSELACPELLPHDAENVTHIVEEMERQEDVIDELLQRSKEQRQSREATGELASLMAQITKMDMDRTRFMLVDLARTRMAKIENHALHNRTLHDRMTAEELSYLRQYGELLEKHYQRTVLDHLPKEAWKKLDEPEMIDTPDLEQFVFCRVLETVPIDVTPQRKNLDDDLDEEDEDFGDNVQEHGEGSYLLVMYKNVRKHVLDGKVELLM